MRKYSKPERQKYLLEKLKYQYRVRKDLATELGHSEKSIRRDINDLKKRGYEFDERKDEQNRIIIKLDREGKPAQITGQMHISLSRKRALRLFAILKKIYNEEGISYKGLKKLFVSENGSNFNDNDSFFGEHFKVRHESLLKNDLKLLKENNLIKEEMRPGNSHEQDRTRYYPGDMLIKSNFLNVYEFNTLYHIVQEHRNEYPYKAELVFALGKMAAASIFRDNSVLENEELIKKSERSLTVGQEVIHDQRVAHLRGEIEKAINQKKQIRFFYKKQKRTVSPVGISYDWNNDRWYLLTLPKKRVSGKQVSAWRIDYIMGEIEIQDNSFNVPDWFDIDDFMVPPSWGVPSGKPVKVKVRFEDIYNIRKKAEAMVETSRPWPEIDDECDDSGKYTGYFIYEDEVAGLDEFRNWLRQFGYSAEVLEPEELREQFLKTAEKMLHRYGCDVVKTS